MIQKPIYYKGFNVTVISLPSGARIVIYAPYTNTTYTIDISFGSQPCNPLQFAKDYIDRLIVKQ